ncbi:aminotransferase class V-fold PLP-dependent enzyme [Candidatus Thiosymbion oneisti]|uniref:aminotransferase class V-fold PLP-dependent enzyme n=1 Tax=Candidatus Thiosymbion oneisti TaxID=589554 RepID=UPI000B7E90DC|nr:aminotransferase class V-fold PLP-dependent enzyme [Candidatus Thiosymbion oneisti]
MHSEFPLSPDILYLNHAAVAPWPRRTVAAVARFAQENGTRGAADYARWIRTETRLRGRLAELIKAPSPADVALVKNTSEGLSVIAYGIDWKSGDNVVGIAQEFPSNRIVWESLGTQGVAYRRLDLYASSQPEADLMDLCDERTRLIALSSVQYARGLRLDLERLGDFCRSRDILFCVDAIQGLGVVPFDLKRAKADFVVADGHKWMLGPEGVALLYVDPRLRPELCLHQYGWHMVEHRGDYERLEWSPAADARRFECGSPNMLGVHALDASLSLLLETGIDRIRAAVAERAQRLIELIDGHGFELLSPRDPERRAGILTFRVPGADHQTLHQALTGSGVICARRGGGIRFSPHFYTPHSVLERAVRITAEAAVSRSARK